MVTANSWHPNFQSTFACLLLAAIPEHHIPTAHVTTLSLHFLHKLLRQLAAILMVFVCAQHGSYTCKYHHIQLASDLGKDCTLRSAFKGLLWAMPFASAL